MKFSRKLARGQKRQSDAEYERRCDLLEAWFRNQNTLPPLEMAGWFGEITRAAYRQGGVPAALTLFDREFPRLGQYLRLALAAQRELELAAAFGIGARTELGHHAVVYSATAERWLHAGCARVRLDDQAAAALCLTDSSKAELENRLPWPAFVVTAPKRTLKIHWGGGSETFGAPVLDIEQWIEYVLVGEGENGGISVTLVPEHGGWPIMIAAGETLEELLASRERWQQHATVCEMAVNLVRGVLVQIQAGRLQQVMDRRPRGPSNRWRQPGELPTTTDYVLGHDVVLHPQHDYVEAARTVAQGTERLYKVQWMVRGHQRWQAHGPRHSLRKCIWILPHMKGRVDAPMVRRDYVLEEP